MKAVSSATKSASDWTISLSNKQLMPDPHTETGSQDVIVINATESLVSLHDVTALRFILRYLIDIKDVLFTYQKGSIFCIIIFSLHCDRQ